MTAANRIKLVSVKDYLSGELVSDVRHEYAGGYVYAMAGATTLHNRVAANWLIALGRRLVDQSCQAFGSDMKVRVRMPTHTRFYYPDGMVVCDPNSSDELFQDRPVIVAEVLSETTRRTDEGEKRDAYLTIPTLSAYLIIDTSCPRVIAHRRTDSGFITESFDGGAAIIPLEAIQTGVRFRKAR